MRGALAALLAPHSTRGFALRQALIPGRPGGAQVIGAFKKMRKISKARDLLLEAVEASTVVVLDAAKAKVKRVKPLPRDPVEALRRSIVLENLPKDATDQTIKVLCEPGGHVTQVRIYNPATDPVPGRTTFCFALHCVVWPPFASCCTVGLRVIEPTPPPLSEHNMLPNLILPACRVHRHVDQRPLR